MTTPSDPNDPAPKNPQGVVPGPSPALEVERADLEAEMKRLKRKKDRHLLWILLGISPGAVVPALGLLREGSVGLLWLLSGLVVVYQGYSWAKASRDEERLEERLRKTLEGA